MALPPAKRQKRMIVLSSDDEEDGSTDIYSDASIPKAGAAIKKIRTIAKQPTGRSSQASLPTRTRAKPKRSTRPSDPTSSNGTTPTSSPAKSKTKSGSLYSFFNAVTQSQQATSTPRAWTATPIEQIDEEDLIEDDPFEEKPTRQSPSRNNLYGTGLGKKSRPAIVKASISDESRTVSNKLLPSSTAQSKLGAAGGSIKAEDPRPWAEQFPPMNLEELAVHKRKSADVKNWLDNVINGKDRKVCHF
jgi:cell cycle checkpoint protein